MVFKLTHYVTIIISSVFGVYSIPPDVCYEPFKWQDCGGPPKAVMYYWKPGSRCEVGYWRGCLPNHNMFRDEYECVTTCIFSARAMPEDYHSFNEIDSDYEPVAENYEDYKDYSGNETDLNETGDGNETDDINGTDNGNSTDGGNETKGTGDNGTSGDDDQGNGTEGDSEPKDDGANDESKNETAGPDEPKDGGEPNNDANGEEKNGTEGSPDGEAKNETEGDPAPAEPTEEEKPPEARMKKFKLRSKTKH